MRLIAASVLALFLCGASSKGVSAVGDFYKMVVLEPGRDNIYIEPVVLIPRGYAYAHKDNNLKNFKVVVEFWHQETGGQSKLIDTTTYAGEAGKENGFNLGFSPQLKAGKGWVGVKVVDADNNILDWSINNYTVNPIPVPPPAPLPPPLPPVPLP